MSSLVIAIFLLSIGASFVQRTTGFGFGIFIMTMLPFFLPTYGEATTLSGLLAITTSAVIVWRMRSYVTWKRLWPILLTFIVVSTITIFALTHIGDHILKRILGVALILISIYFALFSQKIKLPTTKKAAIEREKSDAGIGSSEREQARPKVKVQVSAGTLSGLMGGFFGMQGPPAVLYFIQSEPSKEHYMAMAQTYFLIGNVMMTFVRAYNGFFTTTVLTDYCFGLGGVVIGTTLGAYSEQKLVLLCLLSRSYCIGLQPVFKRIIPNAGAKLQNKNEIFLRSREKFSFLTIILSISRFTIQDCSMHIEEQCRHAAARNCP